MTKKFRNISKTRSFRGRLFLSPCYRDQLSITEVNFTEICRRVQVNQNVVYAIAGTVVFTQFYQNQLSKQRRKDVLIKGIKWLSSIKK